jgi:hypothetical protein
MTIIKASLADINKFDISPITEKNKRKNAFLTYEGKALYMDIGPLYAPFGGPNSYQDSGSYSLNLSFKGRDKDMEGITNSNELFRQLDEMVINFAVANAQKIFGKKHKREVIEDAGLYNKFVKVSIDKDTGELDGKYPDRINLKFRKTDEGVPDVAMYDNRKNLIPVQSFEELEQYLTKGSLVKAIVQPGIWFINNKMGVSWRIIQFKVQESPNARPKGFAFVDDSDVSDNEADADNEVDNDSDNEVNATATALSTVSLSDPTETTDTTNAKENAKENVSDSGSGSDPESDDED